MSTSGNRPKKTAKKTRPQRSFVPAVALAKEVAFDDVMMHVQFADGRVLAVPLVWFPVLCKATRKQREKYEIGGGGISLHWPDLDEDLSIAGLLAGADLRSG